MRKAFSTHWISSTQPRKQRKYRFNAPLHVKSTFVHSHLSKELRAKHNTRSLRVRVGDDVKVMRGQFAGKTGKVERVDLTYNKVFVAGVDQAKRDGTKKQYPLQPSNLMITNLTNDKRRLPTKEPAKAPVKAAKTVKA